jgi:hypothetical protein
VSAPPGKRSLAVQVFRHFCDGQRNFNPAIVVFRHLESPLVFRFFYAFHEARNGRGEYVAKLESKVSAVLAGSGETDAGGEKLGNE